MARPRNTLPKLCTTSDGRAFTKISGVYYALGRAGTPDAQRRYGEILAKHAAGTLQLLARKPKKEPAGCRLVAELLVQYVSRELSRFSDAEQHCQKGAIKVLRETFAETPVDDFGPLKFRLVRDAMLQTGWSRGFVNRQMKRVRSIFKWGASWELVPSHVTESLKTVTALKAGETDAPDYLPRESVPAEDIAKVRSKLHGEHRDIFDLLLLSAARPAEITDLVEGEIDQTSGDWIVELTRHKTRRYGKRRFLVFRSHAQVILKRYLTGDPQHRLFKTGRNYFSEVIRTACAKAQVKKFVPHQLRHTGATSIVDEIGTDAARHTLGHSNEAMTMRYSRMAVDQACRGAEVLSRRYAAVVDAVQRLG